MRGGHRSGGGGSMSSGSRATSSSSSSSTYRRHPASGSSSSGGSGQGDRDCCADCCEAVWYCRLSGRPDLPKFVRVHRVICMSACWWGLVFSFVGMMVCLTSLPLYQTRTHYLPPAGTFCHDIDGFYFEGVSLESRAALEAYFMPQEASPPERVSRLTGDVVTSMSSPVQNGYHAMDIYLPAGAGLTSILVGEASCPLYYLVIRGAYNFESWQDGQSVPFEFYEIFRSGSPLVHSLQVSKSSHYFFVVYNSTPEPCHRMPVFMQLASDMPAYRLRPDARVPMGQELAVPRGQPGTTSVIIHTSNAPVYHELQMLYSRRPGALDMVLGLSIGLPYGLALVGVFTSWVFYRRRLSRNARVADSTSASASASGGGGGGNGIPSRSHSQEARSPGLGAADSGSAPAPGQRSKVVHFAETHEVLGPSASRRGSVASTGSATLECAHGGEHPLLAGAPVEDWTADPASGPLANVSPLASASGYWAIENVPMGDMVSELPPPYSAMPPPPPPPVSSSAEGWSKY
ncbi:hypothetical protein H696_06077 [Fonticula alba]|uniref:Uncharacterized protein n=1 Tax=Fonticula alba TaxID=691883 RepID=A0A058Z0X2_FONAL|nr:hypothetical protein H696_06077 [Fonticula alba]KCV67558.1 hypothetical protein H696_06077 [Fonticula alba]|eukprot:XP_009498119.1 hypothetical protein H696_06077 [Fonticula alba]